MRIIGFCFFLVVYLCKLIVKWRLLCESGLSFYQSNWGFSASVINRLTRILAILSSRASPKSLLYTMHIQNKILIWWKKKGWNFMIGSVILGWILCRGYKTALLFEWINSCLLSSSPLSTLSNLPEKILSELMNIAPSGKVWTTCLWNLKPIPHKRCPSFSQEASSMQQRRLGSQWSKKLYDREPN